MSRFNILMFQTMHEKGTAVLRECCDLHYAESLDEDYLADAIKDKDGVIIRANGAITRRMIEGARNLKVIGRHGVGLDAIDLVAAAERGIPVVSTPEANNASVAEGFFGLAFALAKRVTGGNAAVRAGDWDFRNRYRTASLSGKTLGIYGFGKIGQMVGRMGHFGFDMPLLYADAISHPEAEKSLGATRVTPEELFERADFISINLPLFPSTRKAVTAKLLNRMKPTAFVVNMARGPIWEEADVYAVLKEGKIAGAGSDVFDPEPPSTDNPLLTMENFICSPHNSAHTEEGMINMSMVAADVVAVLQGRAPKYLVPPPAAK
ncbi:D-isomer specific 2-hydroxyacid dehydrogenase, NAD-binding [uncultured delta proteobacterium]|uniref:D-isomer specific 2-hydroxyacid dehydrogenase, NAD-binding n=1 Tax=uncultured delta proteobacterium TaxID=34034 RepID=A0A212JB67_9DELT|nr:D-isomer specific 2-hydroxyacid dehydrogenase, NAD-binding [uncultured delta proteobacterium]